MAVDTPSELQTPSWHLAAIVEVDQSERIQCQCNGCGRGVYKGVHLIQWDDGRIECWGSTCYARELGVHRGNMSPLYSSLGGRRLTADERKLLISNRERLIAGFREEIERAEQLRASLAAARANTTAVPAVAGAVHVSAHDRMREADAAQAAAETARAIAARHSAERREGMLDRGSAHFQNRMAAEPMHDPLYREIRQRWEARWAANGQDIRRPGQYIMFIQNVQQAYTRAKAQR